MNPIPRAALLVAALLLLPAPTLLAQSADVNARIREEGLERSRIMETIHYLTDRYGPRLTGSPSLERAGEWALSRLESYGLTNAHAEPWEFGHPGWENERASVHVISPIVSPLMCEVLAWTPSTNGTTVAPAVHLVPPDGPTAEELEAYLAAQQDRVTGKAVFLGSGEGEPFAYDRPARLDDEQVARDYEPDNMSTPYPYRRRVRDTTRVSSGEVTDRITAMLKERDAALIVRPAQQKDGMIQAFGADSQDPSRELPTVILARQDYGRLARLMASGFPVTLEATIVNRTYPDGRTAYNYIADIPGTDRADEVVMIGGHLDSWHAGTGATDNATGSAVMIEAARILQALELKPRRTIRVALWSGEEQGLLGSVAYVKEHYGSFEDQKPGYEKFGGYLNVDMGTGRVRGATVFGPTEAAQVLEDALAPFADLGVAGGRPSQSRSLGGSDYTAFNQAGLPGISMGQDPIRYFSHTWHTDLDTYEQVLEDDVKQAAVVVAALAYALATRDELLPRFIDGEMPAAAVSP